MRLAISVIGIAARLAAARKERLRNDAVRAALAAIAERARAASVSDDERPAKVATEPSDNQQRS